MTDYTRGTGANGTMLIRDTGTTVEFWLKAGASTYSYNMPWRSTINGVLSAWKEFRFVSGGNYQRVGSFSITTNQTVSFHIGDTGTSGLGGPTTFSVAVTRQTVPPYPGLIITDVNATTATLDFSSRGSGGLPILQFQLGYGTSSTIAQLFKDASLSTGLVNVTGLTKGTTYYFWARARNALGWGQWGVRQSAKTGNVPPAPGRPLLTEAKQTSFHSKFVGNGDGGSPILEWQTAYGTDEDGPQTAKSGYDVTVTNLLPGVRYYVWARGRNEAGWGAYSAVNSIQTVAGVRIQDGAVIRNAIPYVKVAGVWRMALPWGKIAGLWKETG